MHFIIDKKFLNVILN